MKKIILCLCVLFIISGCDDKKAIIAASKKLGDAQSYTMTTSLAMDGTSEYESDASFYVDNKNKTEKMVIENINNGIKTKIITYTVIDKGQITTYTNALMNDSWLKSTVVYSDDYKKDLYNKTYANLINDEDSFQKVQSDLKGSTKYKLTISKDDLSKIANAGELGNNYALIKDITMYIYIKNNNITRIVIDLSNSFVKTAGIKKYIMTMNFSDINKTTVKIPQNIIDNARSSFDINNIYDMPTI